MFRFLFFLLPLLFVLPAEAQFGDILNKAKKVVTGESGEDNIGDALKQALNQGIQAAVDTLSAKNGFYESPYRILVPEEAQTAIKNLSNVPGFQNLESDLTQRLNAAAELAAKKATPIFADAITQMTFEDAMGLLMGEEDAATRYLERITSDQLYSEFQPIVAQSLDEVNARQLWTSAAKTYNQIPFVKQVNPDLDDHVTIKALDGLFSLIEKKEIEIRDKPTVRNTQLLRDVFAKQDN